MSTPNKTAPDFGEPWDFDGENWITDSHNTKILNLDSMHSKNAKRLIACVNACRGMADPAKEIERLCQERDEARAIVSACMSAMPIGNIQTHTPENLAARIGDLASALAAETSENEAMREAIKEAADILAQIPDGYDSRFFRAGQWANAALSKLQPLLKP